MRRDLTRVTAVAMLTLAAAASMSAQSHKLSNPSGMDVVDQLFNPPDTARPDQRQMLREGNDYLQKEFPQLDFVKKASRVPARPAAPARRPPS